MTIEKKNLKLLLCFIAFKAIYMLCIDLMLPTRYEIWDYSKCVDWTYFLIELIPLLVAFFVGFMHYTGNNAFSVISLLVFVMAYIPANSGLSLSNQDRIYYCLVNLYFMILLAAFDHLAQKYAGEIAESINLKNYFSGKKWIAFRAVMIVICLITILYVYQFNGLSMDILSSVMYDTRANYAEYIANRSGTILSYFVLFLMGITTWMLPLYLYVSIYNKKLIDLVLALVTYLALFLMEMQKSTLMLIPVIVGIAFCERRKNKQSICNYIMIFFFALFSAILIEYSFRGESSIFKTLIPRVFYMPTYLNKIFYDFFSIHDKMWFTRDAFPLSNVLSKLIGEFGSASVVETISKNCFNGYIPSPNTGFFAEAYAQAGILGVLILPPLIAFLTRTINRSASWYGSGVQMTLAVRWVLLMLDTQILTASRVVGIILFVVVTWLLKNIEITAKLRS